MADLDTLRPEVREARTDLYVHGHLMPKLQKSIGILDAELLRLADVETELAVLRARIAEAPRVYHSSFEYTLDASTLYARAVGIPGEETYALVKVEE